VPLIELPDFWHGHALQVYITPGVLAELREALRHSAELERRAARHLRQHAGLPPARRRRILGRLVPLSRRPRK